MPSLPGAPPLSDGTSEPPSPPSRPHPCPLHTFSFSHALARPPSLRGSLRGTEEMLFDSPAYPHETPKSSPPPHQMRSQKASVCRKHVRLHRPPQPQRNGNPSQAQAQGGCWTGTVMECGWALRDGNAHVQSLVLLPSYSNRDVRIVSPGGLEGILLGADCERLRGRAERQERSGTRWVRLMVYGRGGVSELNGISQVIPK
mmetsp:Transcript_18280/g.37037  ORF Transcript_18280/g.37037 Transcript_18280/m.37037 type:complete len:201 (+) Transcript_18280:81-683(+)